MLAMTRAQAVGDEPSESDAPRGPAGVLVVDGHSVFREVVREVIDAMADFTWVGEAGSGEQALAAVSQLHPDLVLLDVCVPDMTGVEAATRLRELDPEAAIVLIYVDEEPDLPEGAGVAVVRKQDFSSTLIRRLLRDHGARRAL
jgi:DNA-binding NarL/FixJ family response regulator